MLRFILPHAQRRKTTTTTAGCMLHAASCSELLGNCNCISVCRAAILHAAYATLFMAQMWLAAAAVATRRSWWCWAFKRLKVCYAFLLCHNILDTCCCCCNCGTRRSELSLSLSLSLLSVSRVDVALWKSLATIMHPAATQCSSGLCIIEGLASLA